MKRLKPIEETFLWKALDKILSTALVIGNASMIILIVSNVIARKCFNSTIFGADEILAMLILWMYWLGGVYGSFEDSHISADMTDLLIKNEKVRAKYKIAVRFVTVIITGVFCYWGLVDFAPKVLSAKSTTPGLHIPYAIPKMALVVAFVMMFIFSIYWFVRTIHPYEKKTETDELEGMDE